MTRRKPYLPPGWKEQPVSWSFSVAFRIPGRRALVWIATTARNVMEASKQACAYASERYPRSREYGISVTYWRHWSGYSEPITRDEYNTGTDSSARKVNDV